MLWQPPPKVVVNTSTEITSLWQPRSPSECPASPTSSISSWGAGSRNSNKTRIPGRRFGQIIRLKKNRVDEYKTCHARAWPEVLKQIKDCKIEDYSIWHDPESGLLFSSFKYIGYDYEGDMKRMAENPKVQEWWKMTDSMQESLVEGALGSASGAPGWWKPVEEVFYNP